MEMHMRNPLGPALPLLLFAATTLAAERALAGPLHPGVRVVSPHVAELLEDALTRSPLIRSQVELIDASDLVVYLAETFQSEPGAPKAKLEFVTAAGGKRYVMVCIARWRLSPNERVVLLGHELQHAVEVVRAPEVRDIAAFGALFGRIGWEMRKGRFETEGALKATGTVWAEIYAGHPSLPVASLPGEGTRAGYSRGNRRNP
jgi:hypothetical protein